MGVAPPAPQILGIVNSDGTPNSADHPAKGGSMIALYISGLGQTAPASSDGVVSKAPLPVPLTPVAVYLSVSRIGFSSIAPQSVSAAPGLIAGITQVNVLLPADVGTATAAGVAVGSATAPVYLTQGPVSYRV